MLRPADKLEYCCSTCLAGHSLSHHMRARNVGKSPVPADWVLPVLRFHTPLGMQGARKPGMNQAQTRNALRKARHMAASCCDHFRSGTNCPAIQSSRERVLKWNARQVSSAFSITHIVFLIRSSRFSDTVSTISSAKTFPAAILVSFLWYFLLFPPIDTMDALALVKELRSN